MEVTIHIFRSDGSAKRIPLKPGRYLIGRHDDATLRIPLPTVSRRHCELVHEGDRLHVRDLGSSNGTFRNENRVQETELGAGDVLGIGEFRMSIQIDGQPAEVLPPRVEPTPERVDETPAQTAPIGAGEDDEEIDLDKTVTKPGMGSLLAGSITDESSIFDFDFDFEDDENPAALNPEVAQAASFCGGAGSGFGLFEFFGTLMFEPQFLQRTIRPRASGGTARIARQRRFGHMILTPLDAIEEPPLPGFRIGPSEVPLYSVPPRDRAHVDRYTLIASHDSDAGNRNF